MTVRIHGLSRPREADVSDSESHLGSMILAEDDACRAGESNVCICHRSLNHTQALTLEPYDGFIE